MKRKKRTRQRQDSDKVSDNRVSTAGDMSESRDTVPDDIPRPKAASRVSRKGPPSPVKRPVSKRNSVTAYDLREHLAKGNLIGKDDYNTISTVIQTAKRLQVVDGENGNDGDSGYSESVPVVKPLVKPMFGKKSLRDIVMMAKQSKSDMPTSAHNSTGAVTAQKAVPQNYAEVFESSNLSNEEFEAKIKSMKHIPPIPRTVPNKREKRKVPPTPRIELTNKMALPPIVVTQQTAMTIPRQRRMSIPNQFQANFDREADLEFYKDFKFTYILAPMPADEFPRKCVYLLIF